MNIYVYVWVIFKYENSSEKNRVIINRPLWGEECQMKNPRIESHHLENCLAYSF